MDSRDDILPQRIEQKLREFFSPLMIQLINESHLHAVPKGSETHWNLAMVSSRFAGKSRIERHQAVYEVLEKEIRGTIHALTMKLITPDEWSAAGGATDNRSPLCRGGSKA